MLPPYCVSIPRTDVPLETILGFQLRKNLATSRMLLVSLFPTPPLSSFLVLLLLLKMLCVALSGTCTCHLKTSCIHRRVTCPCRALCFPWNLTSRTLLLNSHPLTTKLSPAFSPPFSTRFFHPDLLCPSKFTLH